jgi:hypothetical protein
LRMGWLGYMVSLRCGQTTCSSFNDCRQGEEEREAMVDRHLRDPIYPWVHVPNSPCLPTDPTSKVTLK